MQKILFASLSAFTAIAIASSASAAIVNRVVVEEEPRVLVTTAAPRLGNYCREYTQTLTIAGETQTGYGTACLQPDGSWELMTPASGNAFNYVYRDDRVYFMPPRPYTSVVIRGGHYRRSPASYHH